MSISSLRVTAARHALGIARAEELVGAADALLTRGVYSYSLGELSTVQNPRAVSVVEVAPLFLAALRELTIPLPPRAEAWTILANHYIWMIAEDVCAPDSGLSHFYREFSADTGQHTKEEFANNCACDVLERWYFEHDVAVGVADYEAPDEDDRGRRMAEIERGIVESAVRWILAQGLGRTDPSWLTWNDGCVRKVAQGIADECAFDRLPILHDALIDAGCDNEVMLGHCREPGDHRKACLVVDLLLGKR